MFKSGPEQERLNAMFSLFTKKRHVSGTDLNRAADEKSLESEEQLKDFFHDKVWRYFAGLIQTITPINPEGFKDQPDFRIYFKAHRIFKKRYWLQGMELTAKVLNSDQSIDSFRQSEEFHRQHGQIVIMQIDKSASKSSFKAAFNSELDRIKEILNQEES